MRFIENAKNYLELSLVDSGKEKCIPLKGVFFHPRDYYLFHYVIAGKGVLELNNHKYELSKGQIFMIPPLTEARYYPASSDPWTYLWVGFNGANVEEYLKICSLSINQPIFNDDKNLTFKTIFERIESHGYERGFSDLTSLGYTYILIQEMINHLGREKKISTIAQHTYMAMEFIKNNYKVQISVSDIASSLGVNVNYLANIFKKVAGISPKEYLTKTRMEKAGILLRTNRYKIKEVAEEVGYPNQLHFSSQFRKYYHCSPSEFALKGEKENERSE